MPFFSMSIFVLTLFACIGANMCFHTCFSTCMTLFPVCIRVFSILAGRGAHMLLTFHRSLTRVGAGVTLFTMRINTMTCLVTSICAGMCFKFCFVFL